MRVMVRRSLLFPPHSGERGLFACESGEIGDTIISMRGGCRTRVFRSRSEWIRVAEMEGKPDDGAVQIGRIYQSDWSVTSRVSPKWYYMNHSRMHANVEMRRIDGVIIWVGIAPISAGEEIYFDYGRVPADYYP